MKKAYEKPLIQYEDFTLSVSIAVGCEIDTNYARNSCGYSLRDGRIVFMSSLGTVCNYTEQDDSNITTGDSASYNGICYHVPTESRNIFES